MLNKSCVQFNGYEVNKMYFELVSKYEGCNEFQISPMFGIGITTCRDDEYQVKISFLLNSTNENPIPFNIEVIMTGRFLISMETENEELKRLLLNENAVAIMFPFLRATIATLTTNANIQPLILPVVNLSNAFKDNNQAEQ